MILQNDFSLLIKKILIVDKRIHLKLHTCSLTFFRAATIFCYLHVSYQESRSAVNFKFLIIL